jgi:hypothetical protein
MALGDDPKTVALHYSAWVPERQERLTKMFKKTYRDGEGVTGAFQPGAIRDGGSR